jgi:predicted nucleic acid-binding protein
MLLVVDASIVVKWLVAEPDSDRAAAMLDDQANSFIAPELIRAEFLNVIWKKAIAGALDREVARDMPAELDRRIDRFFPLRELAARALSIALDLEHPVYDCFYLALADGQDCTLVTADRRLHRAVRGSPWQRRTRLLR